MSLAPVDITGTKLITDRLVLRPFGEDDLEDFFAYASIPGVGEMAGWPHHETIDDSKRILDSFIAKKRTFAVVYKENGRVIGSIGIEEGSLDTIPNIPQREIGYVLSKDYWGNGLMKEALMEGVIPYCFDNGVEALIISHSNVNARSRRVIEKCGFSFVKQIPYSNDLVAGVDSSRVYILYKRDFLASRRNG